MNREINFRVWDSELKTFKSPNVHYVSKQVTECHIKVDYSMLKISGADRFIIQQYTGVKDKNGVEIYGGDIVKVGFGESKGSLGQAIFEYGSFMLTSKYGCNFMDTYKSCLYGEVIGNIFENSELLK